MTSTAARTALPTRLPRKLNFISCALWGRARGRPLAVEPGLLDLVKKRAVADPQSPSGPHAVPPGLLEHLGDRFALGRLRRPPRDLLERWLRDGARSRQGPHPVRPAVREREPREVRIVQ